MIKDYILTRKLATTALLLVIATSAANVAYGMQPGEDKDNQPSHQTIQIEQNKVEQNEDPKARLLRIAANYTESKPIPSEDLEFLANRYEEEDLIAEYLVLLFSNDQDAKEKYNKSPELIGRFLQEVEEVKKNLGQETHSPSIEIIEDNKNQILKTLPNVNVLPEEGVFTMFASNLFEGIANDLSNKWSRKLDKSGRHRAEEVKNEIVYGQAVKDRQRREEKYGIIRLSDEEEKNKIVYGQAVKDNQLSESGIVRLSNEEENRKLAKIGWKYEDSKLDYL